MRASSGTLCVVRLTATSISIEQENPEDLGPNKGKSLERGAVVRREGAQRSVGA